MWCLLPLAVLLSITPTETEVVQSMSKCTGPGGEFLLEKPPQVPGILENGQLKKTTRYKIICQTYENVGRFVTLYDTGNKIPVLSAYKYRGEDNNAHRPNKEPWKIEPQLENPKDNKNMKDCEAEEFEHQASDSDYKNAFVNDVLYTRGHLFPSSFAFDTNDKTSTFTLTNIVPQADTFNSGSWETMENCVQCILGNYCNKQGYVVTGAKPGNEKLKNKVNIPSMLWSAFCCQSKTLNRWIAAAFWRENIPDKSTTIYLPMRSLETLYGELSYGDSKFDAFPGTKLCPLSQTPSKSDIQSCKNSCIFPSKT